MKFYLEQADNKTESKWVEQDNSSQSSSPGVHLLEFGSPAVSTRPPPLSLSLSPLYNPLKHPSFLAVISFPMLSASARFDFIPLLSGCLFVRHPYLLSALPSSASPSSLPLWWIIHQSVYVINQHLFKRYDWGAAEVGDGRGDIDLSQWRTRRGGKRRTSGGRENKRKQGEREHDDGNQETGGGQSDGAGGEEKRAKEGRARWKTSKKKGQ